MKRFITFEGIDGSGKSTITKRIYERLKKEGYEVVLTYEPTDSPIGKYVQTCIKNKSDPYVTSFAFIADRVQHCLEIKKWLQEGRIILCDRYADSTYAYQGAQLESTMDDPIRWLQDLSKDLIITPDRTFLLIIEPEKALKRINNRKELIPFETLSFLRKVHMNYIKLSSKNKRYKIIDADKTIEEITEECYQDITS